ncbi:ABC transporter permease [Adhaeribacter aquaticus]|uniref:ABC transporter permease n=1 Tax=Adhaeribacter aquaticus TaxID=299567 RepID=UPI000408227D|nr:ABC transporter permease [Adhaeribacter aquaticus]
MLKNYFTIAWRNLVRNKIYSAINIIGLATGISACILIFLYIEDELTYERDFQNVDRIARVVTNVKMQGQDDKFARSPYILGKTIAGKYPEAEVVTQLMPITKQTIWIGEKSFNEDYMFFTDSRFFEVFTYELIKGNFSTALIAPQTIVISEELAKKYFGGAEEAMGQTIQFTRNRYHITGIFQDPKHSHLKINALLSVNTLVQLPQDSSTQAKVLETNWLSLNWYTYVLLSDKDQLPVLEQKLAALSQHTVAPWIKENALTAQETFHLQPIQDIHLNPDWKFSITPPGNKAYVYIFSLVAIFILLIACINYMNLATARSAKRGREVGLRKVVGATRSQLIKQFIGESVFIAFFAILLALALVEISLPYFNSLTEKNFSFTYFKQGSFLLALAGIILFVGLAAGSYPAFFLSRFKPVDVLKKDKSPLSSNTLLRKALVVTQFTISIILIIGTIIVFSQLQYIKQAELGFNKNQLIALEIPVGDTLLLRQIPEIKTALLRNPNVEKVATTVNIPGDISSRIIMLLEQNGKQEEKTNPVMFVDYDFLDLLNIQVMQGRNFSLDLPTDLTKSVLVNQTLAKAMGWQNPIGKKVQLIDYDARVVGVVKDFHYTSLHTPIEPLVIALAPKLPGYLLIKVNTNNLSRTLNFIEQKWKAFDTRHPMEYFFLDQYFDKQYRTEEKMLTIFGYFAGLTIIIACLGLFGLTAFTAEQRTREIGIRKVLGGSVADIIILLSKDFAWLVLVAIVLACPIAWYSMHRWLQGFAYRVTIHWWIFMLAGTFAILLTMLTVGMQAAKAAGANPVKSLRSE